MSLLSILTGAEQQLGNTQLQLGVVSNNIGNAQNAGYVDQTATLTDTAAGTVVNVSPNIDQTLQQELFSQNSTSAGQSYLNQVYQQLEQLDGSATGTPSLSSAAQGLLSAFQSLDAAPDSGTAQSGVIQAAEQLVNAVHSLSDGIESMAGTVQSQAQSDVSSLNTDLSTVATLNQQITAAKAAGQSTANLMTERDAAVSQITALVPVNVTTNANGSITLATPGGVSMVSGATAAQFNYTPYTLGNNGVAGTDASITMAGSPSVNLNSAFAGGKIGTELNVLRVDDAGAASTDPSVAPLEKMRRQLDAFVDQFYSADPKTPTAFQAAYNNATAGAAGALAANFFVVANQSPGGQPQGAGSDRTGFELNPALVDGSSTIKLSAVNGVVGALTSPTAASDVSVGDIQGFSGTIADFADAIASDQTQRASQVSTAATQSTANMQAVQTAYSNRTGVSMDQQLSELLVLQNSYSASAKLISIASTMLQTLMSDYATAG